MQGVLQGSIVHHSWTKEFQKKLPEMPKLDNQS
jgi:hypothetical protein